MSNTPLPARDLTHDLLLPSLLFAALGAMTWAVRGCSGFGAVAGCTFAGLMWGVAWWFIAREPGAVQPRRYSSGWIVFALTAGIGIAGSRGWAQWSTLFIGKLQVHTKDGIWVPIEPWYGFAWMFIAGAAWGGLGACALAWCAHGQPVRWWTWVLRIASGAGMGWLCVYLFNHFPQYFMPLYSEMGAEYDRATRDVNNNLFRLTNDNRAAMQHMGWYLGFLLFEVLRRDWKNVTLITTVGLISGGGWAALQNWMWADTRWPGAFNWWRCWESSGGIAIGVAYGVAYYLVNRPRSAGELAVPSARLAHGRINGEWLTVWLFFALFPVALTAIILSNRDLQLLGPLAPLGFYLFSTANFYSIPILLIASIAGILYYLHRRGDAPEEPLADAPPEDHNLERWIVLSTVFLTLAVNLRNGLKGWANIYIGNEDLWSARLWYVCGPLMVIMLLYFTWQLLSRPLPRNHAGDPVPGAYKLVWLMLILQNIFAQLVTGPHGEGQFAQSAFSVYYLALFALTATIFHHYHRRKQAMDKQV